MFFNQRMEKNSIVIYNDNGCFNCEATMKPNDIFESGDIIVTVGKNNMEIFQFSKNNDNLNNNNKFIITKKTEINFNKNFNNDNFINNDNEILCITLAKGFIICGHSNGLMSIWQPDPNNYLKYLQSEKMHNGAINKILCAQLSDNKNYLISCSSDKTIKVYSMEDNKAVLEQKFEEEVMDIKFVKDFEQNNTFIISLKNGVLKALNEKFEILFDIPSRFKTQTTRYVLSLSNPEKNNPQNALSNKGDILVITEGKILDVFVWIKANQQNNHKQNNHKVKHSNPHFYYPGAPFYPQNGF